ncbi:hypothetical protein BN903_41 [Halorubrum sp. AJ67]|nr:hypothetical protein BN903_41 [Halorubrum sp. AJ67]
MIIRRLSDIKTTMRNIRTFIAGFYGKRCDRIGRLLCQLDE